MFRKKFLRVYYEIFLFFYLWFLLFLERVRARVATFTNCAPAMIHHPPLLSSTGNNVFPSSGLLYWCDDFSCLRRHFEHTMPWSLRWGTQTDRQGCLNHLGNGEGWKSIQIWKINFACKLWTRPLGDLIICMCRGTLGKSVIMRTSEDSLQDFFNSQAAAPSVTSS